MPKLKVEDQEEEEDDEVEDFEPEEEEVEPIKMPKVKRFVQRTPSPTREEAPQPKLTNRYVAFVQHQKEGVIDAESKEVVAETIWEALANIIERLERIENTIGGIMTQ